VTSPFDTIAAPITGPGPAAVAIVRLSGGEAWSIGERLFDRWPDPVRPLVVTYGRFFHGDDGFVVPFEAGRSYTGDQTVEMHLHGSSESVRQMLGAAFALGARPAEPGEFTLRAFLNGRIDLTQAEAVRDTVEAVTKTQLRAANRARSGGLRQRLEGLSDRLIGVLAAIEASVDFSEEVGPLDRVSAVAKLGEIGSELEEMIRRAAAGRILREGYRIAIVGLPNAGKSSLLNALLGADRSIVTEVPGTTRDYVEERADFDGIPVVLIDTAGLRETDDVVEKIGVDRARTLAADANEIWYLYDAAKGWTDADESTRANLDGEVVLLANKSDIAGDPRGFPISARTGLGLPDLIARTKTRAGLEEEAPYVNDRQRSGLTAALAGVQSAMEVLRSPRPDDLASVSLREALHAIGQVTGETASPDMVERIFRDFCIGK